MGTARYTNEFKHEAVGQVLERGYSVYEVSKDLGVSTHSLYKWGKADPRNSDSVKAEQIDFVLVSKLLKDRFRKAGVERRGMHKLKEITSAAGGTVDVEEEFDTVTHRTNAASDHGAVWAEFNL